MMGHSEKDSKTRRGKYVFSKFHTRASHALFPVDMLHLLLLLEAKAHICLCVYCLCWLVCGATHMMCLFLFRILRYFDDTHTQTCPLAHCTT